MTATIKQIRAFVAVAKTQSFADACGVVHLSQPALSLAIKKLEESVGGRLMDRTTRTLTLTPEGEAFLPVAQRLLADWDDALEELNNRFALRRGKVAVAAMPSFAGNLLPGVILRYRKQYPQINVTVHDVVAEDVVEMVRSGRVELGLAFDPGDNDELRFTPLFQDDFVAVLPAGHALLAKAQLSWKTLAAENFILLQRPSSIRLMMEEQLANQGVQLTTVFEAHQLVTIGRMVATGLGVSVMPSLCIEQMQEMGAQCRPLIAPAVSRRVGILSRHRHPLSAAALALEKILTEVYRVKLDPHRGD